MDKEVGLLYSAAVRPIWRFQTLLPGHMGKKKKKKKKLPLKHSHQATTQVSLSSKIFVFGWLAGQSDGIMFNNMSFRLKNTKSFKLSSLFSSLRFVHFSRFCNRSGSRRFVRKLSTPATDTHRCIRHTHIYQTQGAP